MILKKVWIYAWKNALTDLENFQQQQRNFNDEWPKTRLD